MLDGEYMYCWIIMVVTCLAFVEDRGGMVLGRLVWNAQASTRVCCGVQSLMCSKCCSLEGHGLPALDIYILCLYRNHTFFQRDCESILLLSSFFEPLCCRMCIHMHYERDRASWTPSYFSWPTLPCIYRRKELSDWYKICHEHDDKAQCQVSLSRSNVHARYLVRIKSDAIHARHAFYYESWNRTAKLYKCIYQIN
jgi:hypothetical protein